MKHQKGIGLIEVMVSLLLLAIAVLGFSAMQMTAVKATDESVIRSRSLSIMRGGAEMMRANPDGITAFKEALNAKQTSRSVDGKAITVNSCLRADDNCTIKQIATRDGIQVYTFATENDLQIKALNCPGSVSTGTVAATTRPLTCLITSWDKTNPTVGDGSPNCVKADGSYNIGSSCFIMEAY